MKRTAAKLARDLEASSMDCAFDLRGHQQQISNTQETNSQGN